MTKKIPSGWQPGQSGNPKGRPVGRGDVALIRAAIGERLPEIIDSLVERALSGDTSAASLLLARVAPPLKPVEQTQIVKLPEGGLSEQGRAVIGCVASGELSVGQGTALLSGLGSLARLVEIDDLMQRVQALEDRHASR